MADRNGNTSKLIRLCIEPETRFTVAADIAVTSLTISTTKQAIILLLHFELKYNLR